MGPGAGVSAAHDASGSASLHMASRGVATPPCWLCRRPSGSHPSSFTEPASVWHACLVVCQWGTHTRLAPTKSIAGRPLGTCDWARGSTHCAPPLVDILVNLHYDVRCMCTRGKTHSADSTRFDVSRLPPPHPPPTPSTPPVHSTHTKSVSGVAVLVLVVLTAARLSR